MTLIPNKIKFSTSATTGTIKVGNFIIGINENTTYGPTSVTGFYQGLSPVLSGYTVYQNKVSGGPSTFRPNNDSEFIGLAKSLGGTNVTGVTDGLVYLNSQSSIIAVNRDYEDMKTSGLTVCLNPSYVPSYPKSGSTFYNLANISSPLSFTMNNGVSYSSDGGGSLVFDGVDDLVSGSTFYTMSSGMTWDVWVKKTSDGNIFNMMMSNSGIPYMAYRGTGSGSNTNGYQVAWYSKTGGTTTQRNLFTTGSTYNINTWYNFTYTLVYDLQTQISNGKIYVNGVLNNSASYNSDSIFQPSGRLLLGNYVSNQYPFPGYISRFLVYDRELSNNEIIQNYQSYLPIILNENIVTNGLVSYLDAGYTTSYPTTGTTWYDVSGYGRNGTLTNGTTYSGTSGGTMVFDGTDDYITLGSQSLITNNFTINLWYNLNTNTTKEHFLFSVGYSSANSFLISTNSTLGGGQSIQSYYVNAGGTATGRTINSSTITNTQIVNLTYTRNNGLNIIYINGIEQTSRTFTESLSLGSSLQYILGYAIPRNKTTAYLQGNIYINQIYNRSLTQSEILQNFNAQKSRFGL